MKIFRNYSFWTAFAGAVVIFLNALGDLLGFSIDNEVVTAVITGFAGVLVVLGVVTMGDTKQGKKSEEQENKDDESAVRENEETKSEEIDLSDEEDK